MLLEDRKFNKQDYDNNYIKEKKDRLNFVMPKGYKARINESAEAQGISASEFVRRAIAEKLDSLDDKKSTSLFFADEIPEIEHIPAENIP